MLTSLTHRTTGIIMGVGPLLILVITVVVFVVSSATDFGFVSSSLALAAIQYIAIL